MENSLVSMMTIGGESTGKTVALSCCYYMFASSLNTDGFMLTNGGAYAGGDAKYLLQLYSNMKKGEEMPNGSTNNRAYEFAVEKDNEILCQAKWLDYRGAMLEGDATVEDRQDFETWIANTELLVYVVPGNVLNDYMCLTDPDYVWDEVNLQTDAEINVTQCIANIRSIKRIARNLRKEMPPILLYVTKSDCIKGDFDDSRKMAALKRLIRDYQLVTFQDEYSWQVLGCHSTLGKNLVLSKENKVLSGFEPKGFEIPLMLAVGYHLSREGKTWLNKKTAALNAKMNELNAQNATDRSQMLALQKVPNSFLGKGLSLLGGQEKRQKELELLNANIQRREKEITQLNHDKAELPQQNRMQNYAQEILSYIEKKGENAVFYLDSKGKERELKRFFKLS
ncbi:MAG: hypothetical protein Q4D90_02945 [bacterium]|nr:hypothetical protein [bacterium]